MDILGVEIFQTGRWNNVKDFTESDLDAMVESFQELAQSGRVPLKLGHNTEQPITDGQPALGWVSRVWRDGKTLLADFTAMPRIVYDAVKAALYNFVSVELYRDVAHNGREYPWVLGAVALLGADIPAVRGLKDLQALAMSRKTALRLGAPLTFTRDVSTHGGRKTMADDNKPTLEQLVTKVTELTGKVETMSQANATLSADNARLRKEAEDRDKAAKAEKVAQHRGAIKLKFDEAIRDKLILASTREMFERDPAFRSDDGVLGISLDFVDSYIKERYVAGAKKPVKMSRTDGNDRLDAGDEDGFIEGKRPDEAVLFHAEQLAATDQRYTMASHNERTMVVLRKFPKLAEAYRSQPGIKGGASA